MKLLYRVFAVIFLFVFIPSCANIKTYINTKAELDFKSSVVLSTQGDFNGDGNYEKMFLSKPEWDKPCLRLVDGNHSYNFSLERNIHTYNTHISDINNDGKDDFILYSSYGKSENLHVYSLLGNEIKEIFSTSNLYNQIKLTKEKKEYIFKFYDYETKLKEEEELELEIYNTSLNHNETIPSFEVNGCILNNNEVIYTIFINFNLTDVNTIKINKIILNPENADENENIFANEYK